MLFDFYSAKIIKNITSSLKYIIKYNAHSIGICYEGGLDTKGRPKDTRTPEQRSAMHLLVAQLLKRFKNNICICGHRDLSADLNGDGIIEPEEWIKQCPCFEVRKEF